MLKRLAVINANPSSCNRKAYLLASPRLRGNCSRSKIRVLQSEDGKLKSACSKIFGELLRVSYRDFSHKI